MAAALSVVAASRAQCLLSFRQIAQGIEHALLSYLETFGYHPAAGKLRHHASTCYGRSASIRPETSPLDPALHHFNPYLHGIAAGAREPGPSIRAGKRSDIAGVQSVVYHYFCIDLLHLRIDFFLQPGQSVIHYLNSRSYFSKALPLQRCLPPPALPGDP